MIRQPFPPPLADNPRARRFRPAGFPCGFTGRAAGVSKYKGRTRSARKTPVLVTCFIRKRPALPAFQPVKEATLRRCNVASLTGETLERYSSRVFGLGERI